MSTANAGANRLERLDPLLEDAVRELVAALDTLSTFTRMQLVRPELGVHGFHDFEKVFDDIQALWHEFGESKPWPRLAPGVIRECMNDLEYFLRLCRRINEFDPASPRTNVPQQRKEIHEQILTAWYMTSSRLVPIIGFLRSTMVERLAGSFERQMSEAMAGYEVQVRRGAERMHQEVERVDAKLRELDSTLEEKKKEIDSAVQTLREEGAKYEVDKQAMHFRKEADQHLRSSRWWMASLVALIVGTLGYVHFYLQPHFENVLDTAMKANQLPTAVVLPIIIGRLLVISVLWFLIVWFSRQFTASRHNMVVNRHRENAISSFQTLVEAVKGDVQAHNAILLQATQAIFSPQHSGYVKAEGETSLSGPILDVMKSGVATPKS